MKSIVVEGDLDAVVLGVLFPQIKAKGISLRVAQGFSNVLAITKTLCDFNHDVLAVLDTDTSIPGNDNRIILDRIQNSGIVGRRFKIAWMDPNIEGMIKRVSPSFSFHGDSWIRGVDRTRLLSLEGFRTINNFIEGKK